MNLPSLSWSHYALLAVFYLLIIRALRYRRRDGLARKFHYPTRASMAKMTVEEAYEIQRSLSELEFPTIFGIANFFGLFKTYGIPSISRLLVQTTQSSHPSTASKRSADTVQLLAECVAAPPGGPRSTAALARINYLHAGYRRAGKISNTDMLYTLSVFVRQPVAWVARYDWRGMTDLERCALGVFWKDVGEMMEIGYSELGLSKGGGENGLTWWEAVDAWAEKYEREAMLPAESNRILSESALGILLFGLAGWRRRFALGIVSALMDSRLRRAMGSDEPAWYHIWLLGTVMAFRKLVVCHLLPPRPKWMSVQSVTDEQEPDPKTGRYHALQYLDHPWYVKPTLWNRWGPGAIWTRLTSGEVPGNSAYYPGGYVASELGPSNYLGKGKVEMDRTQAALRERTARRRAAGCPVPF